MTNPYTFYPWTEGEEKEYSEISIAQKIYQKNIKDPVMRTLFLLTEIGLNSNDYEQMIKHNGRPEVLCELELYFLALK